MSPAAIEVIPVELLLKIISLLSTHDVLSCLLVNKHFSQLARDDAIFYRVCEPLLDAVGTEFEFNRPQHGFYQWFKRQKRVSDRLAEPLSTIDRSRFYTVAPYGLLMTQALERRHPTTSTVWDLKERFEYETIIRGVKPVLSQIILRSALTEAMKAIRFFNTLKHVLPTPSGLEKSMNLFLAMESIAIDPKSLQRVYKRRVMSFNVPRVDNLIGKCNETNVESICKWYAKTCSETPELTCRKSMCLHRSDTPYLPMWLEVATLCYYQGVKVDISILDDFYDNHAFCAHNSEAVFETYLRNLKDTDLCLGQLRDKTLANPITTYLCSRVLRSFHHESPALKTLFRQAQSELQRHALIDSCAFYAIEAVMMALDV